MRMTTLERRLVNGRRHSQKVSDHVEFLVSLAQPRPGQSLLEVGCGNGAAAIQVARSFGLSVTAIDVDPHQIEQATRGGIGLGGLRFETVDGERLPFGTDGFDHVVIHKVTHHIPAWSRVLDEMTRVLKPGGGFVFDDLLYPEWIARVGTKLVTRQAGFPSARALDQFFEGISLSPIHRKRSTFHYELVGRLPG